MKNLFLINWLCVLLITFAQNTFAQNKKVESKIDAVVLFKNYATISAVANANLNEGVQEVYITKMADNLIENTLEITTDGDITVLASKFNKIFSKNNVPNVILKTMNDSIILLQNKSKWYDYQTNSIVGEQALLVENYYAGSTNVGTSPEKTKAMADFYRNRMAEINKMAYENDLAKNNIKKQIEDLELRKKALNIAETKYSYELQLTIQSSKNQNVTLFFDYLVNNASWNNFYEWKGLSQKNPIQVINKATVFQNSGIDWVNVKLSLSNANPFQNNIKPILYPHYLTENNIFNRQQRSSPIMMESAILDETVVVGYGAKSKKATAPLPTQKSNNELEQLFVIEKPYTILTGGSPQMLVIETQTLPAIFKNEIYPKYNDKSFLMAQIIDWNQYKLEPAEISTFWAGRKLGQTYLALYETSDTLSVPMGQDKSIFSKREIVLAAKEKKIVSGNVKEKITYKITIKNTKMEAVEIMIKDQIPLANSEKMEISDKNIGAATLEKETGFLTWNLKLNPNETRVLTFWYEIKYPKNNRPILP